MFVSSPFGCLDAVGLALGFDGRFIIAGIWVFALAPAKPDLVLLLLCYYALVLVLFLVSSSTFSRVICFIVVCRLPAETLSSVGVNLFIW